MVFQKVNGRGVAEGGFDYQPKKASTAISQGAVLAGDGSGKLEPATATDTELQGVSAVAVTSSDSDYADNTEIPMYPIDGEDDIYIADIGAGTYAATMIGKRYDLLDSLSVDLTAQSHGHVTVLGPGPTSSKVRVKFNGSVFNKQAS